MWEWLGEGLAEGGLSSCVESARNPRMNPANPLEDFDRGRRMILTHLSRLDDGAGADEVWSQ